MMEESGSPPPDVLVSGHFKETYGYSVYRSRGSGNWLITYTVHGKGLYRQPGLKFWTEPGDIVLLQPGALHDYSVSVDDYWEFHWAHFQPRLHWLTWWTYPEIGQGLYRVQVHTQQTQERIKQSFAQLHSDASLVQMHTTFEQAPGTLQRELALNSLEEILLLAVRAFQREARILDVRVQSVLDLLVQDLSSPHTLDALAQTVALSPSRLSHLFKQEVGDSVLNVLLSLRLHKAARLLEFSSQSVGRIAEEVGFSSLYYFSRQFRQRFGKSPRAYRAMMVATRSTTSPDSTPTD